MHDDCLRAAKEDDPDLLYIKITKQWIDSEERIDALMRGDGTLLSFDAEGLPEADSDLFEAFEWLWFDFPTPFQRGDIVVSPHSFSDTVQEGRSPLSSRRSPRGVERRRCRTAMTQRKPNTPKSAFSGSGRARTARI